MLGLSSPRVRPRLAMAFARRYPFSSIVLNMLPSTVNSWRWLFRPRGPRNGRQDASSRRTFRPVPESAGGAARKAW